MSTHPGGAISTKWIASTLAMGFARPVGAVQTNRRPDSNRHHRADVMKNRFGRPRSLLDVVKPTSRKWEVQLEYQFSENKYSAQSCKRSAGRLVGAWVQVDCLLLWARCPVGLPLPEEGRQLFGRVRGCGTSGTGRPSPMNQLVVADMKRNRLDAASAVELRILDL